MKENKKPRFCCYRLEALWGVNGIHFVEVPEGWSWFIFPTDTADCHAKYCPFCGSETYIYKPYIPEEKLPPEVTVQLNDLPKKTLKPGDSYSATHKLVVEYKE